VRSVYFVDFMRYALYFVGLFSYPRIDTLRYKCYNSIQ